MRAIPAHALRGAAGPSRAPAAAGPQPQVAVRCTNAVQNQVASPKECPSQQVNDLAQARRVITNPEGVEDPFLFHCSSEAESGDSQVAMPLALPVLRSASS